MIWTLALMLWQVTMPFPPRQYHFRPQVPPRPAVVTSGKNLVEASPTGKCSIPLLNAMDFNRKPDTRTKVQPMPVLPARPNVDPKMVADAPAPPCENWFAK